MKYRSRTDIAQAVLKACEQEPVPRTHILYSAFLSNTQLKQYLELLLERKFISYDEKTTLYKLTPSGKKLLDSMVYVAEQLNIETHGTKGVSIKKV